MTMTNFGRYTEELKETIEYITKILNNEFPTKEIGLEYVVTAILDNKKCYANMILDNCLTSSNMAELNNLFVSYLRDHSNVALIQNDEPHFTDEVKTVFNYAESQIPEAHFVGTQHILLSMLRPENHCTKISDIFKNIGIDYNFLMSMTQKTAESIKTKMEKAKNSKNMEQIQNIPPKSEIGKKFIQNNNYIQQFTIDVTQQAYEGKFDQVVGRDEDISKIIEILARRKKNNVVLVGLGGVGKTSIVHQLASMISKNTAPDFLRGKKIVQLNVSALIAGTYLRGAFEERVKGLFDEMKQTDKYILFIDDIHTVLKSTAKEKDTDISSMINDILANGDIKVIGTSSFKDYRNSIESNTMISRRLQKVVIEPTNKQQTVHILKSIKENYERYHNVQYTDEALEKCVELAERYITDRSLPDSAIDILDFSGAHASLSIKKPKEIIDARQELDDLASLKTNCITKGDFEEAEKLGKRERELKSILAEYERDKTNYSEKYTLQIDVPEIYNAVTELTSIPINKLSSDDKKNLNQINAVLKESIIGQDEAIDTICKAIKRNKIGLGNPNRVIFSGLMVGKSGCGKTYLAKKLAEQIYGDSKALVRIDMSEYSEKSSVSKLIGASAGYIGYDQGGQLTEAIKNKPYCVLLLDEIEKADKEVYNLFLQLFDEGRLTDNSGQLVNFKNVIVLMSSNVGVKRAQDFGSGIGFTNDATKVSRKLIEKEIKSKFMPEFLNRLDKIVYFNDLTDDNIKQISRIELDKVVDRIQSIGYQVKYDETAIETITSDCLKEKDYGARPILRYIQNNVEDPITDMIIANSVDKEKNTLQITSKEGQILIQIK